MSGNVEFHPCSLQLQHSRVWLNLVTMTMEVALGGGRRVCFRLRQTEKERSVTVINVLAESETVISQDPVSTTIPPLTSTPPNHTRAGRLIRTI